MMKKIWISSSQSFKQRRPRALRCIASSFHCAQRRLYNYYLKLNSQFQLDLIWCFMSIYLFSSNSCHCAERRLISNPGVYVNPRRHCAEPRLISNPVQPPGVIARSEATKQSRSICKPPASLRRAWSHKQSRDLVAILIGQSSSL